MYLPWQLFHLQALRVEEKKVILIKKKITWNLIIDGLKQSIYIKNQSYKYNDWGGIIGITWMISYWIIIMPSWVYIIIRYA